MSGLQLIPTRHRIRWSHANARRNTAFLANVPWVARHLDLKVQYSTKEEDVSKDCHDATLLAWGVTIRRPLGYIAHTTCHIRHQT